MSVSCECRVLSGRGLCVGLITRPEESSVVCLSAIVILFPKDGLLTDVVLDYISVLVRVFTSEFLKFCQGN
jgi:hypothetical protein